MHRIPTRIALIGAGGANVLMIKPVALKVGVSPPKNDHTRRHKCIRAHYIGRGYANYYYWSSAYGDGRSASRGKGFVFARTTICFSCEMYPRMKPLKIMLATKHSASSDAVSSSAVRSAARNIDTGMRVLFSAAIHLRERNNER